MSLPGRPEMVLNGTRGALGGLGSRMQGQHRFPHRQLLGSIYTSLGLLVALFFEFLLALFLLLCFWAGYTSLMNKGAARPLTIALSEILAVLSIGLFWLSAVGGAARARARDLRNLRGAPPSIRPLW